MESKNVLPHVKQAVAAYEEITPSLSCVVYTCLHVHTWCQSTVLFSSMSYVIGLKTVVFFLYWGHCECLASLVGPVRVLSAVMLL